MRNLYNDDERMNSEGHELATQVDEALLPIMEKYVKDGYRIRDIQSIMDGVIWDLTLNKVLGI